MRILQGLLFLSSGLLLVLGSLRLALFLRLVIAINQLGSPLLVLFIQLLQVIIVMMFFVVVGLWLLQLVLLPATTDMEQALQQMGYNGLFIYLGLVMVTIIGMAVWVMTGWYLELVLLVDLVLSDIMVAILAYGLLRLPAEGAAQKTLKYWLAAVLAGLLSSVNILLLPAVIYGEIVVTMLLNLPPLVLAVAVMGTSHHLGKRGVGHDEPRYQMS